jgi:ubiquitin-protein ligase
MNKRIQHELKNLAILAEESKMDIALKNDPTRRLPAILFGITVGVGVYAGQRHVIRMDLIWGPDGENQFPNKGMKFPLCHVLTPMYHPNIDKAGNICVSILTADGWNPLYNLETVVNSLLLLLQTPNPDSPQWKEPAKDFMTLTTSQFTTKANHYYISKVQQKVFDDFKGTTPESLYIAAGGSVDELNARREKKIEDKKKAEKIAMISNEEDEALDDLDF